MRIYRIWYDKVESWNTFGFFLGIFLFNFVTIGNGFSTTQNVLEDV